MWSFVGIMNEERVSRILIIRGRLVGVEECPKGRLFIRDATGASDIGLHKFSRFSNLLSAG